MILIEILLQIKFGTSICGPISYIESFLSIYSPASMYVPMPMQRVAHHHALYYYVQGRIYVGVYIWSQWVLY